MRAIAFTRRRALEIGWLAFAAANLVAMRLWPTWQAVPFHIIWVSLTILYGFRVWRTGATNALLLGVAATTGVLTLVHAVQGSQPWAELFEVPLMTGMFLAMVWHARRRQTALSAVEAQAEKRASLLARQERFLQDASHELRTPVTIARGHLEVLRRLDGGAPEIGVALDELARIDQIVERLLLLAKADQPDFVLLRAIDLEPFLEEIFMRWSEVAPRPWRLGSLVPGTLTADPDALRAALDALIENAVKYTTDAEAIELRAHAVAGDVVVEVADEGCGVPAEALDRIFDRFGRADAARGRAKDGFGLGLAIVDAIAKAHGGRCSLRASARGSTFALRLPRFARAPASSRPPVLPPAR